MARREGGGSADAWHQGTGPLVGASLAAFALGQALFVAAVPSPAPLELAAVEAALGLVLVAGLVRAGERRTAASTLALFAGVGVLVGVGAPRLGIWPTATLLVAGLALVGYVAHRYEQVALGLAEPATDTPDEEHTPGGEAT